MICYEISHPMQVVYKPAPIHAMHSIIDGHDDYKPRAEFLVAQDYTLHGIGCQHYALRSFVLYDGKFAYDFEDDTEFRPLPKNWKYSDDLTQDRRREDTEGYARFLEFCKGRKYSNPKDIMELIIHGYYVPVSRNAYHVEADIQRIHGKQMYRLVRKPNHSCMTESDYSVEPYGALFYTYEEAIIEAEGRIAKEKKKTLEVHQADVENDIREMLSRVPEEDREDAELVLRSIHYPMGYSLVSGTNRILMKDRANDTWRTVYEYKRIRNASDREKTVAEWRKAGTSK